MSHQFRLALLAALLAGSLPACKKPVPDYTSPFYRVFEGECRGHKYILHLYRLPSIDTFNGPRYSGSIYDADTQIPLPFETISEKPDPQHFITNNGLPIRVAINAAGDRLTGVMYYGPADSTGNHSDSASFTAAATAMAVPFQYFGAAGFRYYDAKLASSPECLYRYGILRAALKDTVTSKRINASIYKFFDLEDSVQQPAQALMEHHYKTFRAFFDDMDSGGRAEALQWATSSSIESKTAEVVFAGARWLSLSLSEVSDGGMHEQFVTNYVVYDLLTGNRLTLQDVLTKNGIARLPPLLAATLREQYKLSPAQSLTEAGLYENSIVPGDEFYVTETGIGFFYNNYEIASFASGSYNLFIPFNEIGASGVMPLFRTAD